MSWGQQGREASEKALKDGLFLKLEAKGETATVVFLAEPVPYKDSYQGKETSKLMFEVWNVELKRRQVFDVNAKHVVKWWKEIDEIGVDHQYKIERTGLSYDTAFDLRAKVKGEVSATFKSAIGATEPIDIQKVLEARAKRNKGQGQSGYDERDLVPEIPEHPIDESEEAERMRALNAGETDFR